MGDQLPEPGTLFGLTIELDEDGLGWTHFKRGRSGSVQTCDRLPEPLQNLTMPILHFLQSKGINHLILSPSNLPLFSINKVWKQLPNDCPEDMLDALSLLAWWMEWYHRKMVALTDWKCPECKENVSREDERCRSAECASWSLLLFMTGKSVLVSVPKTGTNDPK